MQRIIFLLMAGVVIPLGAAPKIYEQNCLACHQIENKKKPVVGPSLVEINHLYKNDLKGFIKWCNEPGKKRKEAIQMPSMAHVGDAGLTEIYQWMREVTKGKKFVPGETQEELPVWEKLADSNKPRLQRIFLPYTSPASIAVTVNGKHSFCWDTVSCRLRYIWTGGYIDGNPYWRRNGNSLASILGEIYYTAPSDLLSGFGGENTPRFKGYRLVGGLPEFSYTLGETEVSESYSNKNGGLQIQVKMKHVQGQIRYQLGDLANTQLSYSAGKLVDGALELTEKEAASFELVFNPK